MPPLARLCEVPVRLHLAPGHRFMWIYDAEEQERHVSAQRRTLTSGNHLAPLVDRVILHDGLRPAENPLLGLQRHP